GPGERLRDELRASGVRPHSRGRRSGAAERDPRTDPAARAGVRTAHGGDPDRAARILVGRRRPAEGSGSHLTGRPRCDTIAGCLACSPPAAATSGPPWASSSPPTGTRSSGSGDILADFPTPSVRSPAI